MDEGCQKTLSRDWRRLVIIWVEKIQVSNKSRPNECSVPSSVSANMHVGHFWLICWQGVGWHISWVSVNMSADCWSTYQPIARIESAHCHAIKNNIETVQWIKSRNCDSIDNKYKRQISKFKVCALSQSWDTCICWNVLCKIIELSVELPCWRTSLVLQYGSR